MDVYTHFGSEFGRKGDAKKAMILHHKTGITLKKAWKKVRGGKSPRRGKSTTRSRKKTYRGKNGGRYYKTSGGSRVYLNSGQKAPFSRRATSLKRSRFGGSPGHPSLQLLQNHAERVGVSVYKLSSPTTRKKGGNPFTKTPLTKASLKARLTKTGNRFPDFIGPRSGSKPRPQKKKRGLKPKKIKRRLVKMNKKGVLYVGSLRDPSRPKKTDDYSKVGGGKGVKPGFMGRTFGNIPLSEQGVRRDLISEFAQLESEIRGDGSDRTFGNTPLSQQFGNFHVI